MTNKAGKIIGPDSFSPRQLPLRQLQRPQGDDVHLWHLDLNRLSNPLAADGGGQSDEASVLRQRATRRFYLRLLLGAYLGLPGKDIRILRRVKGRPELAPGLANGLLDFSVARSDGCYLIGISNGSIIGVDLEIAARQSGKPLALARRYFSEQETRALSGLHETQLQREFVHTWACKEAIVKASGVGIANQLCRFTVDVRPDEPPAVLDMTDDDHTAWKLVVAEPAKGAIAAVAVRQKVVKLKGFSLS